MNILLQSRLDICTTATLLQHFKASGKIIRSKSDIVRMTAETLLEMLDVPADATFTDTDEALTYIREKVGDVKTSNRRSIQEHAGLLNDIAMEVATKIIEE